MVSLLCIYEISVAFIRLATNKFAEDRKQAIDIGCALQVFGVARYDNVFQIHLFPLLGLRCVSVAQNFKDDFNQYAFIVEAINIQNMSTSESIEASVSPKSRIRRTKSLKSPKIKSKRRATAEYKPEESPRDLPMSNESHLLHLSESPGDQQVLFEKIYFST